MSEKLDEIARACQRGLSDNPGWTARRQVAQIRAALAEQFLAENWEQEARAKKAEAEVVEARATKDMHKERAEEAWAEVARLEKRAIKVRCCFAGVGQACPIHEGEK